MDKYWNLVIIHIILVFAVVFIITFLIKYNNAFKLENRISKYAIRNSNKVENSSLFNSLWNKYLNFVKKQRKKINKLFPTLVKVNEKYTKIGNFKAADLVVHKIVCGILFIFVALIGDAFYGRGFTSLQILITFVIGYFSIGVVIRIITVIDKKKIEKDMLKAIIIMNSAFKSGKSTIQAVEIASKKLPKPINIEFKKIYDELKYGMNMDVVFDRFAKRVNIPEAEYLSSSLTILNKTGGNIVAVFDSIEKTLFDKMKLKEELKNSTVVAKLVTKILLFVPIFFVLIIYLLNPDYFKPFFESTFGYILVFIIVIMFAIYAYLLNKIVKVDY